MATARPLFAPEPPHEPDPAPHHGHHWGRIVGWIVGGILLLIVLAIVAIVLLAHNSGFHRWVLGKVEKSVTSSLGVNVAIKSFALNLHKMTLDVSGVTVDGAAPHPNPPLLQLQDVHVGLGVSSLFQRKWYLKDLKLDHPVVHVYIDKNGNSNLPKLKSSNSKSSTNIFDLGIRHAIINNGEIYYNDVPEKLNADVKNLDLRASFNPANKMYSGTLGYTNGRVVFGTYQPFEHTFQANFDLTPTTFNLHRATLSSSAATINLAATATNFSNPTLQAQYNVTVDGAQVAKLMNNPSVPSGTIRAAGSAQYHKVGNQPAMDAVVLSGNLESQQLLVKTVSVRTTIRDIAAHYSLNHGDAVLHDFHAGVLGGEITAQGTMKQLTGNTHSDFTASVRNVSLGQLDRVAAPKSAAAPVGLTGVVNAKAKASWGKTMSDLVAVVDAGIHGKATPKNNHPGEVKVSASGAVPNTPGSVPIDSEIHAKYIGGTKELAVHNSYVRLPQTDLTMDGVLSTHSRLAIHLQANDLRQLATMAEMFRSPNPNGQTAQPLDLSGQAAFQGTVTGSTAAPHLVGQLNTTNLHVNGTDWKVFRTEVDASPSKASLLNADLEPRKQGRIQLSASAGLDKWAFTKNSPLQVNLIASRLELAELMKLAGKQIPVTGTLNSRVTLHGTQLNPIGNGNLNLTNVNAYNEPIHSVDIRFNGTGDDAHAVLAVQMAAGTVRGTFNVLPKQRTYTAQLDTSGIQLDKIEAIKSRNLGATGVLKINASGHGSFDNPELTATAQIPKLTVQNQAIEGINLNLAVANHVADASLTSNAVGTGIQAKARVMLTGDYKTQATVDTQNIDLQPLVAMYSPAQATSLSGATELHATLQGPLTNKKLLQAHVTIPYLKLSYNNTIQLASSAPILADYVDGVVHLQPGAIKGTDTNIQFQGSIPVVNRAAPMSLLLHGNLDLQIAQLFNPDIRSSGQVRFNIDSRGTTAGKLGGQIDIVDASFASGDMPVGLQHGNGVLDLTTDRVQIRSFEGTVGGGKVTAQGGVIYRPAIQFDLGLDAKGIRMLYPDGMREGINAAIHLAGSTEDATLGGRVDLTDLSFTPAFDLASFIGQFSSGVASPPSLGITQNIHLNLAVHSTNNINLVSRTLSIDGSANLQVRGTAAQPVILGRVNLNSGDVVMNNDHFVLTGGTIQFVNPSQTQPVVNVGITTTIQQYNISMRFQGPVDQMRTQYTSDPALPQADIIHLLAFGETTEAAANSPATPATQQAESLVASQVTSQITSRISKVAGISQLSISPVLGNAPNQGAGANITVQQRVTGNLFITFTTNTANPQGEIIQGEYKVSPRVSFSATRDPNGGFALDTLIKKTW